MNNTGIIILAAGNSTRMGKPKQLLAFNGKTFIEHVVNEAQQAALSPVVVVTGACELSILAVLDPATTNVVFNAAWKEGISSSIRTGVKKVLSVQDDIQDIIISVCDQPYLSAELFRQLIEKRSRKEKRIIASSYNGTTGTPVLFHKTYFSALLSLKGDQGAKQLFQIFNDDLDMIAFNNGDIDIDTESEYRKLTERTPCHSRPA